MQLILEQMEGTANSVVLIVAVFVAYLLPVIVSYRRGHRNWQAILVLNLLLGWTFIGWAVAMVWAATSSQERAS